ncbi:hypothetical protein CN287_29240 [Bacillus cereus]|nr:hypothetical protein CN534_25285 [Bacillus cereus]PEW53377.1 hypothetical protein CN443_28270 [Bacillus cereus]PEY13852.1 hypothetical protein CN331_26765 [Bacillus cereus]PEZ51216.1 hypothetical protein CN370_31205 [Bacillus cereus]PFB59061.1 hypothetical protein CN292_29665 [Bacillus cereus]
MYNLYLDEGKHFKACHFIMWYVNDSFFWGATRKFITISGSNSQLIKLPIHLTYLNYRNNSNLTN